MQQSHLERLGECVKNVAERTVEVNKAQPMAPAASVPELGRVARRMTSDALDAFTASDAAGGGAVRSRDAELGGLYAETFRDLLAYLIFAMEDPRDIATCTHLLFIGKNFEQVGDLAASIAESAVYSVEGATIDERRRENDRPG